MSDSVAVSSPLIICCCSQPGLVILWLPFMLQDDHFHTRIPCWMIHTWSSKPKHYAIHTHCPYISRTWKDHGDSLPPAHTTSIIWGCGSPVARGQLYPFSVTVLGNWYYGTVIFILLRWGEKITQIANYSLSSKK